MLDEALSRDPSSLSALATFVNLAERQGRSQEAEERLSKLIAQDPQNPGLHFLSGGNPIQSEKPGSGRSQRQAGARARSENARSIHAPSQYRIRPGRHRKGQS